MCAVRCAAVVVACVCVVFVIWACVCGTCSRVPVCESESEIVREKSVATDSAPSPIDQLVVGHECDVVVDVKVVVVEAVVVVTGVDGDGDAAALLPLPPTLPPTLSPLRGCQLVCSVHCKNVGAGACLSVCSALCTIGASRARAGSGARMAGIRDELRTSRVMAGAAHGPAVASVGGAAIAPRAIRGLFTAAFRVAQ